jgi:carboxymethylenebutenolidase
MSLDLKRHRCTTHLGDTMNFTTELTAADGFILPAYVALPPRKPRGSVVVLQEIFGVNSHIRSVVDRLAEAGFLAVAPALFHRLQEGVELGYTPDDVAKGRTLKERMETLKTAEGSALPLQVLLDVQSAVQYAGTAAKMDTMDTQLAGGRAAPVGVVGFCWGGLLTWRAASLIKGVGAAVPYYGGGMTAGAEAVRRAQCPVLCHFGDKDAHIPVEGVKAFEAAHATDRPEVEVKVYAADHGFHCDQRGSYNEAAAKQAWERTLNFLGDVLR